ncbi:hypothetical protein K440DRAFT_643779 [Wilcoxina mikolae CBS 423.85]|nr:hypothetical protein K440DRAFT_643779 [Wilcoxina mikolae CBS 423.85]
MQSSLLLILLAAATALAAPSFSTGCGGTTVARPGGNKIGNTAFNNLSQRPNLVQIHEPRPTQAAKPCPCPKEPKAFPILSNYNNQPPAQQYQPKYQPYYQPLPCYYQPAPCTYPCNTCPKPKYGQRKYDGCFGEEEDGEYQEFLALSDSGFGGCCDHFEKKN